MIFNKLKKQIEYISFISSNKFSNKIYKIILVISFAIIIYSFSFNKIKICLCTIGKNENLYIKEFVDYYKKLGYDKIFLYDNNDINGERFKDIIYNEIENGFITLIDYRGLNGKKNPQINAYRDCYKKNSQKYDWLSFFDIDEYLKLIPSSLNIQNFLNNKRYKHCQNVKINWIFYTNNNSLFYENKSLEQRVNIPLLNSTENLHIKSTVRGKLPINYWSIAINPHTSLNKFVSCSSSGKIIDYKSPFNNPPDYKYAHINHLHNKSFEEYCLKIKRGRPMPKYKIYKKKMIKQLFKINRNNKIKLKILKKIFKESHK